MMLFINKMFLLLQFEDKILHENVNFQPLFVVVDVNLPSSSDAYFQQDNAPCHKAQIITD